MVEVQRDLKQVYEYVQSRGIWESARTFGYPPKFVSMSVLSYHWRRYLAMDKMIFTASLPRRGIGGGPTFAQYEFV